MTSCSTDHISAEKHRNEKAWGELEKGTQTVKSFFCFPKESDHIQSTLTATLKQITILPLYLSPYYSEFPALLLISMAFLDFMLH